MLYDTTADVIRKALRGLDLAPSEAAARCGLSEREVISAARGPALRETLHVLAPALGLESRALAGLPDYRPPACSLPEVGRLELPFDDETVNAWLIEAGPGAFVLFDTGSSPPPLLEELGKRRIATLQVLITHPHGDHIGGLPGLKDALRSAAGPGTRQPLQPGEILQFGRLTIHVVSLPGHCPGALGYRIEGLAQPVFVTGDALFAGSIGGCAPGHPYREALDALRREVMPLPGQTVLLPGHGPESMVGSEARGNPFVATGA